VSYDRFGNKARAERIAARKAQNAENGHGTAATALNKQFLGARDAKKVAAIFSEIAENEKAAAKLLANTARAYYEAGNILAAALRRWDSRAKMTAEAIS